jgi:putative ABC transport system ATP-binding protein
VSDGSLRAEALTYRIGGRTILDDVTISVKTGEMLGVSGASGSGKTTLLLLLAGLERPTAGTVRLGDQALHSAGDLLRDRVGFVLQDFGLVSFLTAAENVSLTLHGRNLEPALVLSRAQAALDDLGLSEVAERLVEDLSGGQQQRVAVARALVAEPDLLIADEPTSELDAENRMKVVALLMQRARSGGIVVVSTDDSDVLDACDRRVHLLNGGVADPAGPAS